MSKAKIQEEMQQALDTFFKGKVTVFEAGDDKQRPDYIQQRPFFKVLPQEKTSYLQHLKDADDDKKAYTVTVGKPDPESTLDTENSKFFQEMEQRFRKVRPDMTLFLIDPDLIRGRYLMDDAPDRSLGKSIVGFLKEKLEKETDKEKELPVDDGDGEHIEDAAFVDSSAFSATISLGVTEKNLEGNRTVSIVVGDNPDVLEDAMFFTVPGVREQMAKEGITNKDLKRFTLYHEFGHALDLAHAKGSSSYLTNTESMGQIARHRTECIADAHAILQLARDNGNTKAGELIADVRIDAIRKFVNYRDPNNKTFSSLWNKIDKLKKQNMAFVGNTKDSQTLKDHEKIGSDFEKLKRIGASIAYHTTPVVDASIAFSKKGLADGSLQKMSDLQVLEAAQKLVDENAFSLERMSSLSFAILNGEKTKDVLDIVKRSDEGRDRMPLDNKTINKRYAKMEQNFVKNIEKKLREDLGILKDKTKKKDKEPTKKTIKQEKDFAKWHRNIIEQISKKGGDKKALLSIIEKEQDAIRLKGKKDALGERKLTTINEDFIAGADETIAFAKVSGVVKRSIEATEIPEITTTGAKAVAEYINSNLTTLEVAENGLEKASNRDVSSMTIAENQKAMQEETVDYETVLKSERKTQTLAFKIRKDPEAWKIASKLPELAEEITEKAKKRHPEWIEDYHLNFGNNDTHRVNGLKEEISEEKTGLATAVLETEAIKDALDNPLLKKLEKIAPKTQETGNLNKAMLDKKSKSR